LKEWGSGEARLDSVQLLGPEGESRRQLLAGEPFAIVMRVVAEQPLAPPWLTWELVDRSGLLVASGAQATEELGWESPGVCGLRFDVEHAPLLDGSFHLRLGLAPASEGGAFYHWLDDALSFVVYPGDDERGLVRIEGRWSREEIGAAAELETA
jgi:hypothetical protein